MKTICWIMFLFVITGCRSARESCQSVDEFRRKHFTEAKSYKYIHPISLDTYRMLLGEKQAAVLDIIYGMKQKFGTNGEIGDYARVKSQEEAEARHKTIEEYNKFEEMSSGGGAVCQFEWNDGKKDERGLLVLNHGDIVLRDVWLVERVSDGSKNDLYNVTIESNTATVTNAP